VPSFGLGAAQAADIEVRWSLGSIEEHKKVAVNQLIVATL
jgi:hypothetical protein